MSSQKTLIVGIPSYNDCFLMDFAGSTQVSAAPFGFKSIWLASENTITTSEGVMILPNYNFDRHPHIDILLIPGGEKGDVVNAIQVKPMPFVINYYMYLNFLDDSKQTIIYT